MKALTPELQNLIDKLVLAREIYCKASSRVHDEPMTEQILMLADRKTKFIEDISKLVEVDIEHHNLSLANRLKATLEKIGIEVEHILIQNNEGEILSFLVRREEELIEMYRTLLRSNDKEYDVFLKSLLENQLSETCLLLSELEETKEAYNFNEH
ncbi:hypothetical protein N6H18_07145 [Reichenbachiella agarivorans]|uniref:DUF2383 domain-containing protein n=1 Tax=Reichenbachiella agarivorans TaxID=2979464 RepID=A0ABY6CT81_9BACT|nr:hypothetical protein [Reichenbachiella agarivorans]UXP33727.1 hypothetical protein N6H18_07145 [Reichenbachiella agarivorans]